MPPGLHDGDLGRSLTEYASIKGNDMKKLITANITSLLVLGISYSGLATAQSDVDLQNEDNRIAYSVGVNIGQSLLAQGLLGEIDFDAFVAGMSDQVNATSRLTIEELTAAIGLFQQRMVARQNAEMEAARSASEQFLATNAAKEGVVTTTSGLQYLVLSSGDAAGVSPTVSNAVLAHYHGTFVDGSVFDSSIERGEPAQFGLSQVIPGWTEALQLMKPGDKWRLFIPSSLAYGEAGSPPVIPPFSALIFDVELLEVR
jgi:FKBP-type peptidyl-prolyl cis-trans isomerase FklB